MCTQTVILFMFYELPKKANSSHKLTFSSGNNNPSSIKPTVVWIKISEKWTFIFTIFKKDKIMVPKHQHLMLSAVFPNKVTRHSLWRWGSSTMWCTSCKNTRVGAGNLQIITYKFWCEYLDLVTGQIAAWYYLNSSKVSHSLTLSKTSAKASFMYQQWTTTVHILVRVPTTDSLVFFPKHISTTVFFDRSISNYL